MSGYVYIMKNTTVDRVKVGMTAREPRQRLRELNSGASVTGRWKLVKAFPVKHARTIEHAAHQKLYPDKCHASVGTEIFTCTPEHAVNVVAMVIDALEAITPEPYVSPAAQQRLDEEYRKRDEARRAAFPVTDAGMPYGQTRPEVAPVKKRSGLAWLAASVALALMIGGILALGEHQEDERVRGELAMQRAAERKLAYAANARAHVQEEAERERARLKRVEEEALYFTPEAKAARIKARNEAIEAAIARTNKIRELCKGDRSDCWSRAERQFPETSAMKRITSFDEMTYRRSKR